MKILLTQPVIASPACRQAGSTTLSIASDKEGLLLFLPPPLSAE